MKRPRLIRIILVLVLVVVLGCLSLAIFRAREPRYQGRTLSEWIEEGEKASGKYSMLISSYPQGGPDLHGLEADPDWQRASHAVKHIGYAAVPFLLKWLQADDPPIKKRLIDWLKLHPSLHLRIKSADDYRAKAGVGLWLIGNPRKAGWPGMFFPTGTIRERRVGVLILLMQSEPDKETFVPLLLALIHDEDESVRQVAAYKFNNLYPKEAEAAGLYKIFPHLIRNESAEWPGTNQTPAK